MHHPRHTITALLCACLTPWGAWLHAADFVHPREYHRSNKDLELVFVDIGQGDCLFARTPDGRCALLDAGGRPYWLRDDPFEPGRDVVVPFLRARGIPQLDAIVVSHPHGDHFGGFSAVLAALPVIRFFDNGYTKGDPDYPALLDAVTVQMRIPYHRLRAGDRWMEGDLTVRVLFPPDPVPFDHANNTSLVLAITYRSFSALLMADAEREVEEHLLRQQTVTRKVDLLKVGHHGSRTSSTRAFLSRVRPDAAIISCGRGNRYGHPHPETVKRLSDMDVDLYRTDRCGDITVLTDGKLFTVMTSTYVRTHRYRSPENAGRRRRRSASPPTLK
jgi:competence protein ComEC